MRLPWLSLILVLAIAPRAFAQTRPEWVLNPLDWLRDAGASEVPAQPLSPPARERLRLRLTLQTEGSRDPLLLRRFANLRLPTIRRCFDPRVRKSSEPTGRFALEFQVAANGKVARTPKVTRRTVTDASLEACLAAAVQRWHFPPSEDGSQEKLVLTIVLQPADTD